VPIFHLAITIGGAAGTGFLIWYGFRGWKRYRLITGTETSRISGILGGLVEVKGTVVPKDEEVLESPWTRTPCVYFRFKVEEKRHRTTGRGRSSSYWHKIIDDKQYVKCAVDDGTGAIVVDLEEADLVLDRDARATSGLFSDGPAGIEEVLNARYGESSKGLFFNKGMRYHETVLEPGDEIYVLGDVTVTGGGEWRITSWDHPLIVSDKGERGATRRFFWQAILSWAGAIVVAAVVLSFLRSSGYL
jgi:hypothetical protein